MKHRKYLAFIFLLIYKIVFAQPDPHNIVSIMFENAGFSCKTGSQFQAVLKVNVEDSWHINSNQPNQDFLIPTKVSVKSDVAALTNVAYPKAKELTLDFSDKPVSVFSGKVKFNLTFSVSKNVKEGKYTVPVVVQYQACNDKTCMPPGDITTNLSLEVTIPPSAVNDAAQKPQAKNDSLLNSASLNKNENVIATQQQDNSIASTLEKSGLFLSLFFVFIGGLALNLTPCVYPLIPITIGYFGGQSEGSTRRLFLLGILYVLGMALTYSIIGVVTSLSGAVFGTLMQNSFVIIGIALLFIALALSQFGVYEFKLPDSWVMKAGGAKGGAYGAFLMGLTMGIVAAPCIGPFVLGLVTYVASKGDPFFGFLMFFVMAVGLGFPYLLLALFSGKIKKLPRAGVWMEGVKHIFGFLLLAMSIYFIGPILPKSINQFLLPVFGIISALFLLFIDKIANNLKVFFIIKNVFSVIVIAVSVYALVPSKKLEPEWQKFSEAKYEQSLSGKERMVIDFYADWCIPCKELDAVTFSDSRVIEQSKKFTFYKVDMTRSASGETEQLRNKFKIIGMPTVLIINPYGKEVDRLTGFVNADEFLKIMNKVD